MQSKPEYEGTAALLIVLRRRWTGERADLLSVFSFHQCRVVILSSYHVIPIPCSMLAVLIGMSVLRSAPIVYMYARPCTPAAQLSDRGHLHPYPRRTTLQCSIMPAP
nr:hypothetical protein CFP56_09577 [Quercus suber]